MESPKTASCVAKKWQRGHFLGVFCPFGDPELVQKSYPFLSMHIFSYWFQKCKPFCKWMPPTKALRHLLKKPVFYFKNFKNDKNDSKFLEIWHEWSLFRCFSGPMMLQQISWAYLDLCCSSKLFLACPSTYSPLFCKFCSGLGSDRPYGATFSSLCWLSQASSQGECSPSPTMILSQLQFLAQVMSTWFCSIWRLAGSLVCFAAP